MNTLLHQYDMIREARAVMLDFCATMRPEDYSRGLEPFNNESIRTLHVHGADTYLFWLCAFGFGEDVTYNHTATTLPHVRAAFARADEAVLRFLDVYGNTLGQPITGTALGIQELSITPLQLLTHVFTHEFHHKGQMMSMARMLGYVPVDADVIRA